MVAVDPTYPLFPIMSMLAATLLLLVLLSSFVRQSWNLGVAFLCFWLFWETLTAAINHIVWSDNFDIKFYVYCDIGMHIFTLPSNPAAHLGHTLRHSYPYTNDHIRHEAYGNTYHHSSLLHDSQV